MRGPAGWRNSVGRPGIDGVAPRINQVSRYVFVISPTPGRGLGIWVLLRREGWLVNRKRVRRLNRLESLQLRMRVRRREHIALHRGPAPVPSGPTERWSMDFVHDTPGGWAAVSDLDGRG